VPGSIGFGGLEAVVSVNLAPQNDRETEGENGCANPG
jgi:hypothetical protein